jgi:hypothetical protein
VIEGTGAFNIGSDPFHNNMLRKLTYQFLSIIKS